MTVYEKLQALALAENIKLDDPNANSASVKDDEEDDEDDEDDSYEISWDGGPLGLLFKANANGQPVIRRVNKKGAATGLQYARAGDVLLALNGVSVSATPFSEVIEQLKNPEFPVKLDFRPLKLSDLASAASAATSKWGLPRTGSSIHSSDATSAFCGSPVSSNATVDMRSNRGGGWGETSPTYMPQVNEAPTEEPNDVEYDVVWSEGPLGCELKQRNGLPAVKSVTGTGVTPSVAQIAAGDILVSINGLRTEEIGFKSTVTLMMRATKPVYLRFHRGGARQAPLPTGNSFNDLPPSYRGPQSNRQDAFPPLEGDDAAPLDPRQYTVLWRDGPLGIQIRTSSKGRVVVARLTGAGSPNVNETVKPGDIFVRVAGVDVDSLGIAGAFELLKTVQKPVILVFQRRGRGHSRTNSRGRHPGLPSPAPPVPAPLPSSSAVPSFRQLREEEAAAAAAAAGRPPISRSFSGGYSSPGRSRSKSRGGSLKQFGVGYQDGENYAESDDGTSLQSYDYLGDSPASGHALNVDMDNGLPTYTDLPPPPFPGAEPPSNEDYPEEDSFPPEARDESPSLTGLPPPPSYMDVFTASGRAKDPITLVPPSARSMDLHNIPDDESAGDDYFGDHVERPPPFEAHGDGPLPPPPMYAEAPAPLEETPSLLGQPSRLQELRRQYIESERERNMFQSGSATMVSTYSDIDDSGLVVRHQRHPSGGSIPSSAPANQLPLPELWVRWSDGPLGITFKRKNGQIVVSRLTGSGYSPGLTQLRPGDWLVSFNNQSTRNLRLGETMELLKRSPKPVDMCFIVQ
ncbi:hypothetical protein DVH05_025175 [Phytophthora capsici]|nr:hypothetical protein DVH05_025175 [Phytophthora capsici]